mmetsp:Transcript_92779/g.262008  ORF Transcript_92779/g.262008 Transcript_92779/m.262008 type:complete len:250 (-) Transcript_92779:195-944(-)
MPVVSPFVAAKTPEVCCQGISSKATPLEDLSFLSSYESTAPPSQMRYAEITSPFKKMRLESATTKELDLRAVLTMAGNSAFPETVPLSISTLTAIAPEPSAGDAIAQSVELPSTYTAAWKRTFRPTALADKDHSCFPEADRASTSLLCTTTALCFDAGPAKNKATTRPSEELRCHVRSPELAFHPCVRPPSVALTTSLPRARKNRMGSSEAILRHCTEPSLSATEDTTPAAEATRTRSGASGEYPKAVD